MAMELNNENGGPQETQEAVGRYIICSDSEFKHLKARVEQLDQPSDDALGVSLEANRQLRKLYTLMIGEIDESCVHLEEFDTLLDVMVELERIWFLCEIFLLSPISSKLLAIDYAKWIYETERKDGDMLLDFYGKLDAAETYRGNDGGDMNAPEEGYWETIYILAVQGSLTEVWHLLCLHSDFPRVDIAESTGRGRRDVPGALELKAILSSHPFLPYVRGDMNVSIGDLAVVHSGWSRELALWKERIQRFWQSGASLLGRIPEIAGLLQILGGKVENICAACKSNWLPFTLGKLLYVFSPPLSRSNIAKIVDEAIALCNSRGDDRSRLKQQDTIRNIIGGEVGVAIRHMHESKNAVTAVVHEAVPFVDLAFALPTVFLCYNLINGGGMLELQEPLVAGDDHSSYFERLLVSVVNDLISHRFPVEMVVRMINICPTLGSKLSTEALPLVVVDSDDLARELAQAVRAQASLFRGQSVVPELLSRAREIEVARGLFWLDQEEAARAIGFFDAADDVSRCTAVIDATMMRLVQAVSLSTSTAFDGLRGVDLGQPKANVDQRLSEAKDVLGNISHSSYMSAYIHAIEQYVEASKSLDADRFAVGASAMAALVDSKRAPRRYLIHFIELINVANDKFQLNNGNGSRKALLTKHLCYRLVEELEAHASSTDFARVSMGIQPAEMAEMRKKLLSMLSDSCLVENATHKEPTNVLGPTSAGVDLNALDLLTGISLF